MRKKWTRCKKEITSSFERGEIRMKTMKKLLILSLCFFMKQVVCSQDLVSMKDKRIFLDSMNLYRSELGLKKVRYSVEVETLAKIRTKTIYNHLKTLTQREYKKNYRIHLHEGFGMDAHSYTSSLRVQRSGFNAGAIAENVIHFVGYTNDLIPLSFEGWKNSPDHWVEMMDKNIDHISLHFEKFDNGILAVMILFVKSTNR